ncbi:MAG: N-acetyltransferase [Chloroflexota bacterium]|nr:N-acetyltransferase [Chloroflexota bacterium]
MPYINLRVHQVDSDSDRKKLVKFPFRLYKDDPCWVAPLIADREKELDPAHNPSFEYLEVAYFVAEAVPVSEPKSGGTEQIVGTIAAIYNPNHMETHNDRTGFFGLFEVVNDYEIAEALLDAASDWLRQKDCNAIRGPITFTMNDVVGMLVDGFDDSPRILMPYNMPYYPEFVEAYGFEREMDLLAYKFDLVEEFSSVEKFPPKLLRVVEKLKAKSNMTLRTADMDDLDNEVLLLKDIYNQAWELNWGAVPITDAELMHTAAALKPILDPDLLMFVEVDGKQVGVALTLPDFNFVLQKMGGHLFPFGVFKALWYQNKIPWARVWALGVIPEYRKRGVDAVLFFETAKETVRKGYHNVEASWILETNDPMNLLLRNFGGVVYKRYRAYQKDI